MSLFLILSLITLFLATCVLMVQIFTNVDTLVRVITLDLLAIVCIGFFLILCLSLKEVLFLDMSLILALVGFLTSLVFASFLPSSKDP